MAAVTWLVGSREQSKAGQCSHSGTHVQAGPELMHSTTVWVAGVREMVAKEKLQLWCTLMAGTKQRCSVAQRQSRTVQGLVAIIRAGPGAGERVTTSPGPQHPPIHPAMPTQMRRKPLPPNTVTGKPGSRAKPARPTPPVRTGMSYKTPTAFATPEYVDATVFSSSPTSETDSSGKPRYQAPHVKYMKKDEDVPCSITSSLEHFPQEEAGIREEPTRPPQNPPTNLTVVTVEGCPTFVILDWEKPDNDTVT
ncbi:PREDICTED: target of Nesh-SH3-like, partial [Buceros rhinoceros silvestris]|uniref:target of Nesh-SH3-like n=1 Tax=Buceros rhinoceros silvestris TaxID=175836 RepID=UPI000528F36D